MDLIDSLLSELYLVGLSLYPVVKGKISRVIFEENSGTSKKPCAQAYPWAEGRARTTDLRPGHVVLIT